jgi:hypothetical protein
VEQLDDTGPAELPILQLPRTASSGRRLIAITLGGSYGLFDSGCLFGSVMGFSPCSMAHATIPATGSRSRLIQNQKGRCRFQPIFDIGLGGSNAICSLANAFLFDAAMAEFTIAVRRNFQAQAQGPQMRGFA